MKTFSDIETLKAKNELCVNMHLRKMIALAKIVSIAVIAVRATRKMVVAVVVVDPAIPVKNARINNLFKMNEPISSKRAGNGDGCEISVRIRE